MQMFQTIGAVVGGALLIAVLSVVWPRFSTDPRPEVLTKVHDVVRETPLGKNLESVLGVSDDASTPVGVGAMVTSGANAVIDAVAKSAQHAVTAKILESLADQFERMNEEEKDAFREKICVPSPTPTEP